MNAPNETASARVLVAIVNYRAGALVIDCVSSLTAERALLDVVVVDNASGDGSYERISRAILENQWSAWVRIIALDRNVGFAGGNNAAVSAGLAARAGKRPEFVWFLNPDTYIRRGACSSLVRFLELHPDVGIAGSRLEDPDGTQQSSRYRFPSIASELESGFRLGVVSRLLSKKIVAPPLVDEAHETDWVAGASMMVKGAVLDDVGSMDDGYFLYFEETDFCLAAKRKGWKCWFVPESRVVHLVGQSTGVTVRNAAPRRLPDYWFESRRRYFVKNHGRFYAACADLSWAVGYATWRVRRPLQGKPDRDPPHLLSDFLRHSFVPGKS